MVDKRTPEEKEAGVLNEPQPDDDIVQVDAGTSSAVHEIELEETMEEEVQPENQPLEERDA